MAASGMTTEQISTAEHVTIGTVQKTLDMARERVGAKNIVHLATIVSMAGHLEMDENLNMYPYRK